MTVLAVFYKKKRCMKKGNEAVKIKRNKSSFIEKKHKKSVLQTKIINKQINKQVESNNKNLKKIKFLVYLL